MGPTDIHNYFEKRDQQKGVADKNNDAKEFRAERREENKSRNGTNESRQAKPTEKRGRLPNYSQGGR